ncbi:MAG: FecR domain-containing protein [Candidatus Eremiobacteraeota bacterium]|nr:FecR domain-containing protein [Candidatus Eremiobacteraeota bacterium]
MSILEAVFGSLLGTRRVAWVLAGMVILVIAVATVVKQDSKVDFYVAYCEGSATVKNRSTGKVSPLTPSMRISQGDTLTTRDKSRAVIVVKEGSSSDVLADLRIGDNSVYRLESEGKRKGALRQFTGNLLTGAVWINDEKSSVKKVFLSCRTRDLTVTPVGTEYQVHCRRGATEVNAYRGTLEVVDSQRPDTKVQLEPGYEISSVTGGSLFQPRKSEGGDTEWTCWNKSLVTGKDGVTVRPAASLMPSPSPTISASAAPDPEKAGLLLKLGDMVRFEVDKKLEGISLRWVVRGDIGTIDENGLFVATREGTGEIAAITGRGEIKTVLSVLPRDCRVTTYTRSSYEVILPDSLR